MFRKVVNNDGVLESLNDKRTSCILLLNGLISIIDHLRSRILSLSNLELLKEIVAFMRGIYLLIFCTIHDYVKTKVSEMHHKPAVFYPLIWQVRQMEIFSYFCDINSMLLILKKGKYFHMCNKLYVMNHFFKTLKPLLTFLEKFLVDNNHFHVTIPPPDKKVHRYVQKYY